jgi:hypothetical protein
VSKASRIAGQVLHLLEQQQRIGFRDTVTGDEPSLLQHYNRRQTWYLSTEEVPTRVARTMAVTKTMVTMFLSIHGAIFIDWLPPGEKFTSGYFCEKILDPLSQVLPSGHSVGSPRSIVHFHNATPHRSAVTENCFQHCQFRRNRQSPYSLDISSYNFFLFADLKVKLKSEKLENVEELQNRVEGLLTQVTSEKMQQIREHRIGILNQVAHTGGESVSSQLS